MPRIIGVFASSAADARLALRRRKTASGTNADCGRDELSVVTTGREEPIDMSSGSLPGALYAQPAFGTPLGLEGPGFCTPASRRVRYCRAADRIASIQRLTNRRCAATVERGTAVAAWRAAQTSS